MKRILKSGIALNVLAFGLLACGGGGDSAPPSPNPPGGGNPNPPGNQPPPISSDPYRIEYHGDSTIWGWMSNSNSGRVGTPAPAAFADSLPAPAQSEVRNEGRNGTAACELLNGISPYSTRWEESMIQSGATHVIVNHAINDPKNFSVEQYASCLRDIVTIARRHGKEIVLETPNPALDARVADYAAAMRSVAAQQQPAVPVIDQHTFLTQCLAGRGMEVYVPDGEHPTQEVYIAKGRYAAAVFARLYPRQGLNAPAEPACP